MKPSNIQFISPLEAVVSYMLMHEISQRQNYKFPDMFIVSATVYLVKY